MATADLRHDLADQLAAAVPSSWKVMPYLDVVDEIEGDALLMVGNAGGAFDPAACSLRWRLQIVLACPLTEPGPADDAADALLDDTLAALAETRWLVADVLRAPLASDDARPCYVLTLEDLTLMTAIGYLTKEIGLTVDATEYHCEIAALERVEDTTTGTVEALCPDGSRDELGSTRYSYNITYNQDYGADSFLRFLDANHGGHVDVVLKPDPVGYPAVTETGSGQLISTGKGFTKGSTAQGTARILLDGKPTLSPAA